MAHNKLYLPLADVSACMLPGKGLLWEDEGVLFVADVHLGKEHAFGRSGIAIPAGSSENTLNRLSKLLLETQVDQCVVLGDFFHDTPQPSDSWLTALSQFLDNHSNCAFSIVAGNHDKKRGQALVDDRIVWHNNDVLLGPWVLRHEPGEDARGHVLAGHIHPVVSVSQKFQRGIRGPCFWHQPACTVLPAFGDFTGGYKVTPSEYDSVFLTGPDCVIPIPTKAITRQRRALHHS